MNPEFIGKPETLNLEPRPTWCTILEQYPVTKGISSYNITYVYEVWYMGEYDMGPTSTKPRSAPAFDHCYLLALFKVWMVKPTISSPLNPFLFSLLI